MNRQEEIHVVIQERTGLFRKVATTFLTLAVIVASITILTVIFAGEAPEELLIGSLVLAAFGIGFAIIDWVVRLARDGIRSMWQNRRKKDTTDGTVLPIDARIHALENELRLLRAEREAGAGPTPESDTR
ncbi:MAG: hypothetical protein KY455_02455 [Euryarchaeota archaeon]|nr:hypothetical protein [Euryarchaeota archaeon]